MAGVSLHVNSGEVALVAATAKTVLQIKSPANQRLLVTGLKIFGKANAGGTDQPVKFRLTRNSASFGTGSSATPSKNDPSDAETVQSTAFANFTVEPTTPTDAGIWYELSPQTGAIEYFPFDKPIKVPGGQSLQVEATALLAQTVAVTLSYDE